MPRVTTDQKYKLQDAGVWPLFHRYRDQLKNDPESGYSTTTAHKAALDRFFDRDGNVIVPDGVDVRSKSSAGKSKVVKKKSDDLPADFDLKALPAQSMPIDMIRWVAANLSGDEDYSTCPGRDAYSLLADCKSSPSFRQDFWKTMYTKILPSRAQLSDDNEDVEMDGQKVVNVLDKIVSICDRVSGGAG